jgi:hypothetical protein
MIWIGNPEVALQITDPSDPGITAHWIIVISHLEQTNFSMAIKHNIFHFSFQQLFASGSLAAFFPRLLEVEAAQKRGSKEQKTCQEFLKSLDLLPTGDRKEVRN